MIALHLLHFLTFTCYRLQFYNMVNISVVKIKHKCTHTCIKRPYTTCLFEYLRSEIVAMGTQITLAVDRSKGQVTEYRWSASVWIPELPTRFSRELPQASRLFT